MDADSWATREKRFWRKFEMGRKYIPDIFQGLDLPDKIEQKVVLVFASKQNHQTVGGGELVLIDELLEEIFKGLQSKELASSAVPEHLSILRSFQFVTEYRDVIMRIWQEAAPPIKLVIHPPNTTHCIEGRLGLWMQRKTFRMKTIIDAVRRLTS